MSTTLVLTFPLGRFHANPWGRHVNQGEVEIPPSPWRLLRALYSVWQTRAPDLDAPAVLGLLSRLAGPPTMHVPRHVVAHTRHYYPDSQFGTDRTFDAFAAFDPTAEWGVTWDLDLNDSERPVLDRLASSLPYLGRADSICRASLTTGWRPVEHETWSVGDEAGSAYRLVDRLAPQLPLQTDALLARPVDVRAGRLLFPPGSRMVTYRLHEQLGPLPIASPQPGPTPTAIRFDILQAARPSETEGVVYTDLLRQACLSRLDADPVLRTRTLLGGRTADGRPMTGHGHAHYLALVDEARLSGLVVWVPAGLDSPELAAAIRVRRLQSSWEKDWSLHVRASGVGSVTGIAPELVGPARIWRSATPFVPPRFRGRHQSWDDHIEAEIMRELGHRGLAAPEHIGPASARDWREFVRYRPSRRFARERSQGQANRPAAFVELAFAEPVAGPLTLGHLSHFGLGLFVPRLGGTPRRPGS